MTLEARKNRLVKLINNSYNELLISKLESLLDEEDIILSNLSKPMKEKLDIEALMKEQNYKHPSKELLNSIIEEANIEESIEDLLEMI